MFRKIVAFVLGVVAGSAFNMALVTLSHAVYPMPDTVDPNDFEAFRAQIEANGMPVGAMLIVLAAHAGGSLVSGFVCALIATKPWYSAATALGTLWMSGGIAMLMMLPSPIWFAVVDIALYIPCALLGAKLGGELFTTRTASGAVEG